MGYFDEREEDMLILRKVAYVMFAGKLNEFNKFWPVKSNTTEKIIVADDMREEIMRVHKLGR